MTTIGDLADRKKNKVETEMFLQHSCLQPWNGLLNNNRRFSPDFAAYQPPA